MHVVSAVNKNETNIFREMFYDDVNSHSDLLRPESEDLFMAHINNPRGSSQEEILLVNRKAEHATQNP